LLSNALQEQLDKSLEEDKIRAIKVVVWDLDHTVWDGVLLEDETVQMKPGVLEVIKELAEEGWTMVIVTHELAFARQTADEVVFMAGGVVVERGPASQVLRNPQEERTQAFVRRLLHEI